MYREETGDLIELAKQGKFDVIAHGCNCWCSMGAGIAPLMAKAFGCDMWPMENPIFHLGKMNKLGTIDYKLVHLNCNGDVSGYGEGPVTDDAVTKVAVVNCYTQFDFTGSDIPLDYAALTLCMRKMNYEFKGKHIGLPKIGCGLAGGDWELVQQIIEDEFTDCDITVVLLPEIVEPNYHFFWNGPFSNWHPSPFTINNMEFTCEEQHMMYWKAVTFEDYETATKIMETVSPKLQKALGRQVKNFDQEHWLDVCQDIVFEGLEQKFLQNPDLLAELERYKDSIFVEASPQDRIWGIGYSEVDALDHIDDWGMNILGILLTKVAKKLCK